MHRHNLGNSWRQLGYCSTGHIIGYYVQQFNIQMPLELLKEALDLLVIPDEGPDFLSVTIDMGRHIGKTNCVPVTEEDDTCWACCEHTPTRFMRFVQNKQPISTSCVAVRLKQVAENTYKLTSAYLGTSSELFPYDRNASAQAKEFWHTHALVPTTENPIIPSTIRIDMPLGV